MTTDTQPRQKISVSTHLGRQYGQFSPDVSPATPEQHIACVEIMDGLRLQTSDPSIFRELAQAFLDGAYSLEAVLPSINEAAPRCSKCSHALVDDDPSNTGLGYHVDCTTDGALAGQPS